MANEYNNDSIKSLKGADRVRLRPSVIFGSNGLEGCCHSFFEILSNSIDEFKEGRGSKIIVTRYADLSLEVTDFGNGIPVDFNQKIKPEELQKLVDGPLDEYRKFFSRHAKIEVI